MKSIKIMPILLLTLFCLTTVSYAFDNEASQILPNTSAFNGVLSTADDNVQKALDTIDDSATSPTLTDVTITSSAVGTVPLTVRGSVSQTARASKLNIK